MHLRDNPFKVYIEDFEAEAEDFLRKYRCESAIYNPQPIPIFDIATKLMSLEVVNSECLSLDGRIQGAITFTKGIVDVYDWQTEEYIGYQTQGPAIFIDSSITNEGRIRNTLAHECFHWWKHRNYFNFQRTQINGAEFGIRCDKNIPRHQVSSGQWTDVERMEWQANTIAPKILMPRVAAKKKIDALFEELTTDGMRSARVVAAESVVARLAEFFQVSRQSAAIRMIELGYYEAEPYTSLESYSESIVEKRQHSNATLHQQPITKEEAFRLYSSSEFLQATIDTGAFCFVDGYFVLRNEKYVTYSLNKNISLTEYAQAHLHECTLDFSSKLIGEPYLLHDATACLMYRSDTVFKKESIYEKNPQNTEQYNKAVEFERRFAQSKEDHRTASEMLQKRMKEKHWNSSTFQSVTKLDAMQYTRVQKGYDKFTLRPLITMGYCLGMDVLEMEKVLNAAGLSFNPTDRVSQAYRFLFTAFPNRDIDECNKFLKDINVPLLGSQPRF